MLETSGYSEPITKTKTAKMGAHRVRIHPCQNVLPVDSFGPWGVAVGKLLLRAKALPQKIAVRERERKGQVRAYSGGGGKSKENRTYFTVGTESKPLTSGSSIDEASKDTNLISAVGAGVLPTGRGAHLLRIKENQHRRARLADR